MFIASLSIWAFFEVVVKRLPKWIEPLPEETDRCYFSE
jgi:hypothetical protein